MTRRSDLLPDWLARRGGVVHGRSVGESFSRRDVEEAVARGAVRRIRRSWLAAADAHAGLVAAATVGGRLTCVSAAKRMGLWVPAHDGVHVSVPRSAGRIAREGLTVHWAAGIVPTPSRTVEEPLPNVLLHVALCLDRDDAFTVWESAARTTHLTPAMLRAIPWRSTRARALADACSALSDSGLESYAASRFRALGLPYRQQVRIDGHPVDGVLGERLVVQIDGAHHLDPAQRRRDIRDDARLALMGYTVLRFDYRQILFEWEYVEATILTAVARGLHRAA